MKSIKNKKFKFSFDNMYYNSKRFLISLGIAIIILFLLIFLTGCSNKDGLRFNSFGDVSSYCYSQNITETCGIEKCVMINSAEFNSDIRFTTEKNYYQCKLLECGEK